MAPKAGEELKLLADNRKAKFNYDLSERFEAGIVLLGWEVKSIRGGHITLGESFIRPFGDELFLIGAHITPYVHTKDREVDPTRKRKLLLKKAEIVKLLNQVRRRGFTIVPTKAYLKKGFIKIEIALAKGKAAPDKRESVKKREADRAMARAIRNHS
jgi:SsrA-binding protein